MSTSVYTGLNPFSFVRKTFFKSAFVWEEVQLFSDRFMRCFKPGIFLLRHLRNDFDALRSIESEMSINFLSFSSDVLPLRSLSNTEPVSRNFSISLRTALR
jgi:hypothetical protein